MKSLKQKTIIVLGLALCMSTLLSVIENVQAQDILHRWDEYNFKTGVYVDIEHFKNNSPMPCDIDLSKLPTKNAIDLKEIVCLNHTEYKSKKIWGICIEGRPFVRHGKYFFPVVQIGALTTYYYIEVTEQPNSPQNYSITSKIRGKVIDINTGEVYDQKGHAFDIVQIIKADPHFQNQKIKAKDIGAYITAYNKRHPLEIGVQ